MQVSIWRFPSFIGQHVHGSKATKKKKNIFIHTVVSLEIWKFHRSTGPQVPSKVRKRKESRLMQLSIWRFPSFIGQQVHRSQAKSEKENSFYARSYQFGDFRVS